VRPISPSRSTLPPWPQTRTCRASRRRSPSHPPLFGDLSGFPPSLVFAGGDEVLLADAIELTRRLALAGVTVESHLVAGMQHVWVTLESDLPDRALAFADLVRFVNRVT
jgi:monoterpene epsilon-lactone hydrolase